MILSLSVGTHSFKFTSSTSLGQDHAITHLEEEIERHLHPFEEHITRAEKINGVSRHVLSVLMAEVGTDLERFPDAEHLGQVCAQGTRKAQGSD